MTLSMHRVTAAALLLPVLLLAACGGDGEGGEDAARRVKEAIPAVTKTVTLTEATDQNGTLGQPGSYTEAISIYDSRAICDSELDISCGAKIEVFETEEAATARKNYIDGLRATDVGALAVKEYDYLDGPVLLRVSGQLTEQQASEYAAAVRS